MQLDLYRPDSMIKRPSSCQQELQSHVEKEHLGYLVFATTKMVKVSG